MQYTLKQYRQTKQALINVEESLFSLKIKLYEKNPTLYYAMAQDYLETIKKLRNEIDIFFEVEAINLERKLK